ncbi:cupin domain-containing protein [Actinopolymorpha pittospori]|uniref:Mannose-6-phosphate isomerase-like protein (Cupin superfamily) n=1 Tax=Actinopolymorpha pittospori TaxID=648752 RepID=A0A927RL50_9ACTN|nr:cupin domain-containing protein [Actinopolymorpha pittospori]MBE1607413.1 mannose-6-phosphate isomerase-like protein (cupin superfamily) [Actinopolymorpha pittospori]
MAYTGPSASEHPVTDHHAVIENPASGERIVVRTTAEQTGGELLVWELFLAPGGRVPSTHAHPVQEECFRMLSGTMRFRVGLRSMTVGPGMTVRVPPGAVHRFANAGPDTAHVLVETRPALAMQDLLETAAALARRHRRARRLPRPLELALFMREFEREVRAPYLPTFLVRGVVRPLAWLARGCGLDQRYRRSRSRT